jgi:hypothetical protein
MAWSVLLAVAQRLDGGVLGGGRRAHDPVLVHLGDPGHQGRRGGHVPMRQPVIA